MTRLWFVATVTVAAFLGFAAAYECDDPPPCAEFDDCGSTHGPVHGVPIVSTPIPSCTFFCEKIGGYSYESSSTCLDGKRKDPITIIFVGSGEDVITHAAHHGSPGDVLNSAGPQNFRDNGNCNPNDYDLAENDGEGPFGFGCEERWHLRGERADVDHFIFGEWQAATPHRDRCAGCGHYVQAAPQYGVSGFDAGREEIVNRWVIDGGHGEIAVEF